MSTCTWCEVTVAGAGCGLNPALKNHEVFLRFIKEAHPDDFSSLGKTTTFFFCDVVEGNLSEVSILEEAKIDYNLYYGGVDGEWDAGKRCIRFLQEGRQEWKLQVTDHFPLAVVEAALETALREEGLEALHSLQAEISEWKSTRVCPFPLVKENLP
jgi:hypothetical protein